MTKETEELRSRIPEDVLKNIRTDDPRVLRKIVKSFERQNELRIKRADRERVPGPDKILVSILKEKIRDGSIEIRTTGGTQTVVNELLRSKTAVCLLCPDFETEVSEGRVIYKSGGIISDGIGMTGKKLISSIDLIENIGKLAGNLDLFVIYQASAEDTITSTDKDKIKKSAEALRNMIELNKNLINPHFLVLDSENLIKRSRELANTISLSDIEAERLSKDREEIIRMRLGLVCSDPLSLRIKRQEALFDIAIHLESENIVREMIGKQNFVHFSVDSARFSGYYQNPAIAIGRNLHYKGD